jgi:hypothetical protein
MAFSLWRRASIMWGRSREAQSMPRSYWNASLGAIRWIPQAWLEARRVFDPR